MGERIEGLDGILGVSRKAPTNKRPSQVGHALGARRETQAPKTIYRLEADAVSWALEQPAMPRNSVLRIDNEALVHALHKGRSNTKEANAACAALFASRLAGFVG